MLDGMAKGDGERLSELKDGQSFSQFHSTKTVTNFGNGSNKDNKYR